MMWAARYQATGLEPIWDNDHNGLIAICDGDLDSPGLDANLDCEHPTLISGHLLAQVASY